jgi:AcrR family transcriptional regulator
MHSESKELDRRADRTRRSLSHALIELIQEKNYDAITVQNVIDRADVGRSTFYAHYRGKEDLFRRDVQRVFDGFARHIEWQKMGAGRFVPVKELFLHVQDFHKFYRALVRSGKTDVVFKTGQGHLSASIESSLNSWLADKPQPATPVPIVADYLAQEILSLLKWWLDHNMPYPPQRMDEIFHELVIPGVRAVLRLS